MKKLLHYMHKGKQKPVSEIHRVKAERFVRFVGRLPKALRKPVIRFRIFTLRHRLGVRVGCVVLSSLILFSFAIDIATVRQNINKYDLSKAEGKLLKAPNSFYGQLLQRNNKTGTLTFNADYAPSADVAGETSTPKITASFSTAEAAGKVTVNDPVANVAITMTPKFKVLEPQQDKNRVVYALANENGAKVYTLRKGSVKEDIILYSKGADRLRFDYELEVPNGLETRMEANGDIGVYGVNNALLGNVSTGTDADVQVLENARKNGEKNNLLFVLPAPVVMESGKKISNASAWFELHDKTLSIVAQNLHAATYPLSIDPSVYVESAAQLMKGNNETNTDFDVDDELIQKSQTTGARIDNWEENQDLNQGTWDNGVAVAGGYIYSAGGRTGVTKPWIVSSQGSIQGSDSSTFTMAMPSVRPAGDLYVAMMCHDGTGTVSTVPSGWTKVSATDTDEFDAWYKVGTDQGGGNESASYNWGGISEEWAGTIIRIKGFNSGTPITGTPGTANAGPGTPTFPATTPGADSALILRGIGINDDEPSDTGWVPAGHTKIYSATSSTGTGSCGVATASLNVPPASGVSSGTSALIQTSLSDTYGGITVAINPASVTPANQTGVYWAKFNSTSLAIESPNPGTGACSAWCTDAAYDLPEARRGFSMVAYNGYLYVLGGSDGTNLESTVLIAKLGANGEPQLWHPTGGSAAYWYQDTGLNGGTARYHFAAYAYNNRMYVVGGDTNTTANSGASTTVEVADILPNGRLGSWSSTTSLPTARYDHTVHVYNDFMYVVGGNNNSTMLNTVHYAKIKSDGTLDSWTATNNFTTARSTHGGSFSTVWGAYIYLAGGCTTVNASGYCSAQASDTQIASINADGSLAPWGSIAGLENQRIGYTFVGWQNGLYRVGGCIKQNTTTGECTVTVADVDYGVVNPAGEVSTVSISTPSPGCGGVNCDLPPPGDAAGQGGQLLSMSAIMNGYLYNIGGCVDYDCDGTSPGSTDASGNISYSSISSTGTLTAPASCSGTSYGHWCVDSTNRVNGTAGVAAAGVTTFNNRIYIIGGLNGTDNVSSIFYNDINTDGSLNGAWESVTMTAAGITEDSGTGVAYTYAYARANPASAGTNPGNLYIFGGCGNGIGAGLSCEAVGGTDRYESEVYKCNITTTGAISGCTTTGQLQIDAEPGTAGTQGLGIHSGAVNANYIYLIGGYTEVEPDKDDVMYAKFDNSNNVVAADGGSTWIISPNKLSVGRRRGFAFGYNGHIYSLGGYDDDGTTIIPFIEWSKMDVSDGSIDSFVTSSVQINQRWGLSVAVSNSYAYVLGGCDAGSSPSGCTSFESAVQTFQLYNNNSGAAVGYAASANQFTNDRIGSSSAVLNGYLYVAGGCNGTTACTSVLSSVQYASIDNYGVLSSWSAGGSLPAAMAWGQLEAAGGTLYYVGGQTSTPTDERSEVYYTSSISSGNPTWNGSAATNGLPAGRTMHAATVWNDRIYVVGGNDTGGAVSATVYISPSLSGGGNITSAWSTSGNSITVARNGTTAIAYANNLYILGGYDGSNYLNDVQYTQINTDGTIDSWNFSTSLPSGLRQADGFAANGYMYIIGGRSADASCTPNTLIAPITANTTIASGNNPTGLGDWYETNARYTGDRYGAAVSYYKGKIYITGGGCQTFPTVTSITTGSDNDQSNTTNNVTMPATVEPGDLLLVLFSADGNGALNTPSGWTAVDSDANGTAVRGAVFAKSAVGTEDGTTVNFSHTSATERTAWQVYRVLAAEWYGDLTTVANSIDITTTPATGASNNPNPPSLNPANWDVEKTLWIAFTAGSTYTALSSAPSGYGNTSHVNTSTTDNSGASSSSARLASETASQDPGTFTMTSTANDSVTYTIAIRPANVIYTGANRASQTTLYSQPQVAIYSRMIDTDTDVFPNSWLMNGLDNSIGARWQVKYRSMHDISDGAGQQNPNEDCGTSATMPTMTTWGQETNYGNVTLGDVATYTPLNSSGGNINCARYFYFYVSIDASQTFGYPEDVSRGPTITDLSLFFTADPSKRLRHGKTFTGGELQPLDTPCRKISAGGPDNDCPLP